MDKRLSMFRDISVWGLLALCLLMGNFVTTLPSVAVLIVLSIFLFIFGFLYTNLAMAGLIMAMLLSPQMSFGAVSKHQDIMVRLDDLLLVVFALAWLARSAVAKQARFIKKFPINRFVFIYIACCIFSTSKGVLFGSVVPLRGFFFVFKYIEYFVIFYLASGVITEKKQILLYLKIFIVVFAVVNIYAFTQIGHIDRVSAPFQPKGSEPNTLGGYQVLLLGVILGLLTHAKLGLWKWPLAGLVIFSMIPFGYTLSRASYMALLPMYGTLIVFNRFATKNILIAALIGAAIVFLFLRPEAIMNRLQDAFTPEFQEGIPTATIFGVPLGPSASARVDDWIDLYKQWLSHPFFGFGVTGTRFVDGQYIKVLVETGAFGFAAFILMLGLIFRHTLRIYRNSKDDVYRGLAIGFLAGHVGMLVHALATNTFIIIRIMEPYWFLAAMVMMIPYLEKTKPAPAQTAETNKPYLSNVQLLLNSKWNL